MKRVPGLGHVARDRVCSAQLQVRQRADRIGKNDAAMIQDLLEFRHRLLASASLQVRPAATVGLGAGRSLICVGFQSRKMPRIRTAIILRSLPVAGLTGAI
jgi:hypothetical protein